MIEVLRKYVFALLLIIIGLGFGQEPDCNNPAIKADILYLIDAGMTALNTNSDYFRGIYSTVYGHAYTAVTTRFAQDSSYGPNFRFAAITFGGCAAFNTVHTKINTDKFGVNYARSTLVTDFCTCSNTINNAACLRYLPNRINNGCGTGAASYTIFDWENGDMKWVQLKTTPLGELQLTFLDHLPLPSAPQERLQTFTQ